MSNISQEGKAARLLVASCLTQAAELLELAHSHAFGAGLSERAEHRLASDGDAYRRDARALRRTVRSRPPGKPGRVLGARVRYHGPAGVTVSAPVGDADAERWRAVLLRHGWRAEVTPCACGQAAADCHCWELDEAAERALRGAA